PRLPARERTPQPAGDRAPSYGRSGQAPSAPPVRAPAPITAELKNRQERAPPFSGNEAVRILEVQLGAPVSKLFAEFDRIPVAAGSLGQVHRAVHFDGRVLAVKIRRPNVVHDVERDLSLMTELAILIERHSPEAEIFDPVGLVNQFARVIRREINFAREGRTMDEFRRLFRSDATLAIPAVLWDLTTEAVLTMEFIDGLKITDREALV